MTWYLGKTTTKQIRLPRELHYRADGHASLVTQERGEFAVERQLRALGIEAHAPRKIEFKRIGKKRHAEAITSPYLPGYIFADIPADLFAQAINCKGIGATLLTVTKQEVRKHVRPFLAKVDAENAEAERIVASRDRAAMCEFEPGQALEILDGPFGGRIVEFARIMEAAYELHPMIEFEAQLFGRFVRGRIDPLSVKGAA